MEAQVNSLAATMMAVLIILLFQDTHTGQIIVTTIV